MIEEALRRAQALARLGRCHAGHLVGVAREALHAGHDTPALCELAMLDPAAPLADASQLLLQAADELKLPRIGDDEALEVILWEPARRIAREMLEGKRRVFDGAKALDAMFCESQHPPELRDFDYVVSMLDAEVIINLDVPKLERFAIDAALRLLQK